MPFGLGGKGKKEEKEKKEALGTTVIGAEEMNPNQEPMPQDLMNSIGGTYYLLVDDLTLQIMASDPKLKSLIPAMSHLNRTTKITRRDAELEMLDMEYLLQIHKMDMDEDEFDHNGMRLLQALNIFGMDTIYDKIEGHRGKLITEKIKIIEAKITTEKKKGVLG